MLLPQGRRAAPSFPFAASVCLALVGLGAPAEGSYGVALRSGRGPRVVTLDPEGNRQSVTSAKGQLTTTLHDELGKPLDITQPPPKRGEPSPVTHFRYDENRNLIRMEDADHRVTKLDYDELNRLFKTTRDPGGLELVSETTEFDADGRPLRIAEANGEVTRQTWDELGRLGTRTHEAPAAGWTAPWAHTTEERYSYDPNSNLERVEEHDVRSGGGTPPVRVTTRGYDRLDRQTSETVTLQDGSTKTVTTEYYRDGRVKVVTDPSGATRHTYDGQGREEIVTTSAGETRKTYYPDDLVKDITFPNETKRAHVYDKADRLLSIVTTKDGATVASTAYTYDPNGNRLTQVQMNGGSEETTTYTYDDLDRLATVTYPADATHPNGRLVTYGHDGAGNRKAEVVTDPVTEAVLESKTGVFDDANRLTELTDNLDGAQTTTLAWNRNGNLVSETKAGVTTLYRFDLRDTLAEVERGGQTLARFLGDFDERRVLKIGDPTRPGGSGAQEYLYNGSRLVIEIENGLPTSRYEWTNEELVSLLQSGGTRRYFALDGLETVLALTDELGAATDRLDFDAWGVPKPGTDFGTSGSRFAFTSHRFDTELDLYYAGGRMCSPTIGRFISQDTLALEPNNPDTWNLFRYAAANPTRYIDPTGHAFTDAEKREIGRQFNERTGPLQRDRTPDYEKGWWTNAVETFSVEFTGRLFSPGFKTYQGLKNMSQLGGEDPSLFIEAQVETVITAAVPLIVKETAGALVSKFPVLGRDVLELGGKALERAKVALEEVTRRLPLEWSANPGANLGNLKPRRATAPKLTPAEQLKVNEEAGAAFDSDVGEFLTETADDVVAQVSIRPNTPEGPAPFRFRPDYMTRRRGTQEISPVEAKSSSTAPLTPRQKEGIPLLEEHGGTVVGKKGGDKYPPGSPVPPGTTTPVIRPDELAKKRK